MKISAQIDAFLTFLRACDQQYHMAVAEEQETNDLTNDLYHFMEFSDENPDKLLQIARELVKTRRRRRAAKDVLSVNLRRCKTGYWKTSPLSGVWKHFWGPSERSNAKTKTGSIHRVF